MVLAASISTAPASAANAAICFGDTFKDAIPIDGRFAIDIELVPIRYGILHL